MTIVPELYRERVEQFTELFLNLGTRPQADGGGSEMAAAAAGTALATPVQEAAAPTVRARAVPIPAQRQPTPAIRILIRALPPITQSLIRPL
jgi:hypothetical protein